MNPPPVTTANDDDHLKLLAIFHYVLGGLIALFSCFPIIHLALGLVFIFAPDAFGGPGAHPPAFIGWLFVLFAAAFILFGWVAAAFIILTGRFLAKRTHYLFCLAMAGVECVFMPLGTVLGVFTLIVLMRDSVKALFAPSVPP